MEGIKSNYKYVASKQNTRDLIAALRYIEAHKNLLHYLAEQGDEMAADLLEAYEGSWSYKPSDVARFIEAHQSYVSEREPSHA